MTGRYRIHLSGPLESDHPATEPRIWRKRWSVFVRTCESLAADGLQYSVRFVLSGDDPHILINASGTPTRIRRRVTPRRALPPPARAEDCAMRALEAEWFLPENQVRRNNATAHWRRRGARFAELGAMAEAELRAEVEFWRELELLSGQRQHFKPGLTHETEWVDDEVAA